MSSKSTVFFVHGATGHLGHHIIEQLMGHGIAASSICAGVRDMESEKAYKLARKGVKIVYADYMVKETLEKAYQGVHTVIHVPVPSVSTLVRACSAEHSICAAKCAGVTRFVAISVACGARSDSVVTVAAGYQYLESRTRTSGMEWLVLRMGLFIENNLDTYKAALETGTLAIAAKPNTYVPYISRKDIARGIAAAVVKKNNSGRVYDLENNVAVSYEHIAEILSSISGQKILFKSINAPALEQVLKENLPKVMRNKAHDIALISSSLNDAAAAGEFKVSNDLYELTGKRPESIRHFLERELGVSTGAGKDELDH